MENSEYRIPFPRAAKDFLAPNTETDAQPRELEVCSEFQLFPRANAEF